MKINAHKYLFVHDYVLSRDEINVNVIYSPLCIFVFKHLYAHK